VDAEKRKLGQALRTQKEMKQKKVKRAVIHTRKRRAPHRPLPRIGVYNLPGDRRARICCWASS
jgi:hypothetical protein